MLFSTPFVILLVTVNHAVCEGFLVNAKERFVRIRTYSELRESRQVAITLAAVAEASRILADWDKASMSNTIVTENVSSGEKNEIYLTLRDSVRTLNQKATDERSIDSTQGRCMLGICASSAAEGIATLKSWVTNLELPRGLLHGMDVDGVPLEFNGSVYIKYNSGGVYNFADIRKSQMGFNALWKPGDAMLEEYDGNYRGVYFQVELSDGDFRQYLLPLDLFDSDSDNLTDCSSR